MSREELLRRSCNDPIEGSCTIKSRAAPRWGCRGIYALRSLSVETGSLACLGCGYEHNCSLHGCAVIREAVEALEELPNNPLTLEELRGMDGEPVWIAREDGEDCWALIRYCNFYGIGTYGCGFLVFDTYSINWLAYRREPEEIPYEGLD